MLICHLEQQQESGIINFNKLNISIEINTIKYIKEMKTAIFIILLSYAVHINARPGEQLD